MYIRQKEMDMYVIFFLTFYLVFWLLLLVMLVYLLFVAFWFFIFSFLVKSVGGLYAERDQKMFVQAVKRISR